MNKGDLIEEIYQENDLTKAECRKVVDSIFDSIVDTVSNGEVVRLVNFGTFSPSPRKATEKVHPVTGAKIEVPAKVVPKFSSGKGFEEALKNNLEAVKDGAGELEVKRK